MNGWMDGWMDVWRMDCMWIERQTHSGWICLVVGAACLLASSLCLLMAVCLSCSICHSIFISFVLANSILAAAAAATADTYFK
uniref:Caveolin n=1 Tax=Syphacia muris TaxID=451379 RepID=A0A0N5ABI1_9BILA